MTAVAPPWETPIRDLPDELAALAEDNPVILNLLALAYSHTDAVSSSERGSLTGRAWRHMGGMTAGQRIGTWQQLCDVVGQWRAYDMLAGSTGEAAELHIPARYLVEDDVRGVVRYIRNVPA